MTATESDRGSAGPLEAEMPDPDRPRIVLSGATGRLGRTFAAAALARGYRLSGAIASDRSAGPARTLSSAGVADSSTAISSSARLSDLLDSADVYVACAPAAVEAAHLPAVARARVPAVLATTGFSEAEEAGLDRCAREIPILREANFSVGLNWIRVCLAAAGPAPAGFDRAVLEAHRRGKRDRPSGTARTLALELGGRNEGTELGRSSGAVETQSLRLGELPGIHQLWFASSSELIRIEHMVIDRGAFAAGMVEAVGWIAGRGRALPAGWYHLSDALRDRMGVA